MAEIRSRTSVDRSRRRSAAAIASWVLAAVIALVAASSAFAQPSDGAIGPTYQRKGTHAGHGQDHHGDWRRRKMPQFSSQVNAGSFQRPYPYHLDYYRMKWGGSYAPYFGNLYGPPNNYFFGTPFFGGFSPCYGDNGYSWGGFPGGIGHGYGGPGSGGPIGYPNGPWAGAAPFTAPVEGEVVEQTLPSQ